MNMILDVDTIEMGLLTINGNLIFQDAKNPGSLTLKAR